MHRIIQHYQWVVDVLKAALGWKKSQSHAAPSSTLTAQGAKVTDSPVASGTNISQRINSPTVNLSLVAPTLGTPGRERYDEWRELIEEIHESIEQMGYAFMPLVAVKPGDERNDYQAGIRRGNRVLRNRILIAEPIKQSGLIEDWDDLVAYAHDGRGPRDRWQHGCPTMGGFDTKAREFQEKLMRVARQDIDTARGGPAPTVVPAKTERPVPNLVYAGGKRKFVFISPSQNEGICDPRTEDERTNSVEAFLLKFENRKDENGRMIGRALNVIAKMTFRHKNEVRERDIDYGVWLNSPCNSTEMGIGDTRELVLMCVLENKLVTFEDRRSGNRFFGSEGFAYIQDGDVEDYDRVDVTIIDQNSQASLRTKLKVWREGASFFSSEL